MSKIKFPKNFNPHYKPWCPSKPRKETSGFKDMLTLDLSNFTGEFLIEDLINKIVDNRPLEASHAELKVSNSYGFDEIRIIFKKPIKVKNKLYKELLAYYEKDYEEYKEKLKDWQHWKAIWDEEQKKKELAYKKRQLARLKKELGED